MPAVTDFSTLKPHHSTCASSHSFGDKAYLDFTFSVMVECNGHHMPMVVVIDEVCDKLFHDIQNLYAKTDHAKVSKWKNDPKKDEENKKNMRVVWGHGCPKYASEEFVLDDSNLVATLRLVKSRNGVDVIATSKYDH